mgnify:CR=1 FL=1
MFEADFFGTHRESLAAWEQAIADTMQRMREALPQQAYAGGTPEEFAAGHLPNAINIPHEKVLGELAKRGVAKDAPVGFSDIRLAFDIEGALSDEQRATLGKLTERYCVILQTLKTPPRLSLQLTSG